MEAHYESFVVRVWVDPGGHVSHGTAVHTKTGRKHSFLSVAEIAEIVTSALQAANSDAALREDGESAADTGP